MNNSDQTLHRDWIPCMRGFALNDPHGRLLVQQIGDRAHLGNFYLHHPNCALHHPPFKKNFLNYPPPFSLHTPTPVSSPSPSIAVPISSPPLPSNAPPISFSFQQRPQARLLSSPLWHRPLPLGPSPLRHCPLPPFRHCPPSSHLLLLPQHLLPAPALFRCLPAPRHRPFRPLAPPFVRHRSVKQDLTKGFCSILFGRTKGIHLVMFGRRENKGPLFGQTRPNRSPSFGLVWPNSARREGALGVREGGAGELGGCWGAVLEKGEEMGGEGGVGKGKGGDAGEEMFRGGGGGCREKKEGQFRNFFIYMGVY